MKKEIYTIVNETIGAYTIEDGVMKIFLQRQGSGCSLFFGGRAFGIKIDDCKDTRVEISNPGSYGLYHGGQISFSSKFPTLEAGKEKLKTEIKSLYATTIDFHPGVYRYCHGTTGFTGINIKMDSAFNDYYLTRFLYCKDENIIVDAITGGKVLKFKGGGIDRYIVGSNYTYFRHKIREVSDDGFHECDFKKGEDYCKERFAWLAGEYYKELYGIINVLKTTTLTI